jgi:hypothetical protein
VDDGSSTSTKRDRLWALLRVRLAEQIAGLHKAEQQFVLMFVARLSDGAGDVGRLSFWLEDLRQTDLRLDLEGLMKLACESIVVTARDLLSTGDFDELEAEIDALLRFAGAAPVATSALRDAKVAARELAFRHLSAHPGLADRAQRVSQTSVAIGRQLRLAEFELQVLEIAGLVYDLGKTCLDAGVLASEQPLLPDEWDHVRAHTTLGEAIVAGVPALAALNLQAVARSHHERFDGHGYPDRLVTRAIPLHARIVGVADAYHAMTSARPFADPLPHRMVVETLAAGAGSQWDPNATQALIELIDAERTAAKVTPLKRYASS